MGLNRGELYACFCDDIDYVAVILWQLVEGQRDCGVGRLYVMGRQPDLAQGQDYSVEVRVGVGAAL